MKKTSGDVIILNLCNKKHDHMYAYSDMEYDRPIFVILGHFLLFYPTIDPENQNLDKILKTLLHMCATVLQINIFLQVT